MFSVMETSRARTNVTDSSILVLGFGAVGFAVLDRDAGAIIDVVG